jgi:4-hydroxy-tetrahydrodipicolinate synthase
MTTRFPGVYVAVVTPFDASGAVDYGVLAAHVEWLIGEGIDGIAVTGSVGEYAALTDEERRAVVETVIETANGRVPVIAGPAAPSTAKAVGWAQHAKSAGAAGLMVLPPINYHPSIDEVFAYYQALSQVGLPIVAYNNPIDTSTDLTPDILQWFAREIENLVGVKEFSGDVRRITAIVDGTDLEVLVGVDDLLVEGVVAGATGWIAGLTNAFPRESVDLFRLARDGRIDEAMALYRRFLPLLRYDARPSLVQAIKYACELAGRPVGITRPPRLPLSQADLTAIEEAYRKLRSEVVVG